MHVCMYATEYNSLLLGMGILEIKKYMLTFTLKFAKQLQTAF